MRTNLKELRSFLAAELKKRTERNSGYSRRAFARDLGVSATALSEFLEGRRNLSYKNIDLVFSYLNTKIYCSFCDHPKEEVRNFRKLWI